VYTQELFAPILSIVPFDSVDEGVDLVNDTPYGLCAGIFTNDLGYALGLARRLDAGLVKINDTLPGAVVQAPFGGWKESGTSFNEMGTTARLFYTRPKTTYVRWRMPASGWRS
jgi:acyl-CoA reductase-like NAD-dependent aldehyde dehydrogenase